LYCVLKKKIIFRGRNGAAFRLREDGTDGALEAALKRPAGSAGHSVFALYVGLQVDSEVEAYVFYKTYSWELGFGIKRGRKYENTSDYKSLQEFNCSCEVHLICSISPH
jgi:hypothetical protein